MRLFAFLLAPIVLWSTAAFDTPPHAPNSANLIASDTLRLSIDSGEPLVTVLPGESSWTYRSLRAPALSWLVGRSFYWKTLPGERGREFIHIERRYRGEPQDTLVVVVDVGTG